MHNPCRKQFIHSKFCNFIHLISKNYTTHTSVWQVVEFYCKADGINVLQGQKQVYPGEEKVKTQLPFSREDFSFPRSDSPDQGKEQSSRGKRRGRGLFYRGYTCFMPYLSNVMTPTKSLCNNNFESLKTLRIWLMVKNHKILRPAKIFINI